MDTEIISKVEISPSAVAVGALPDGIPAEMATVLAARGRAVFQENDVILERLLT
jgi:hypothetical protein